MANGYKQALDRFEAAVRAHAFRGASHPGERPGIDAEYENSKRALISKLSYRDLSTKVREQIKSSEEPMIP